MERSLEDSIKNKNYIDSLRSAAKYSKEVIDLVEADIEYGLTVEQVKLYVKKEIKFPQMKLLSEKRFLLKYVLSKRLPEIFLKPLLHISH